MDQHASLPNHGVVAREPENETQLQGHVAKRLKLDIQPETLEQLAEENSRFSYSVAARFEHYAKQAKEMVPYMKKWCQKETPAMQELEGLAPFALNFKNETMRSEVCSCTLCRKVAELKENCESFLKFKDEYAAAKDQHVNAVQDQAERISRKFKSELISLKADCVAHHAETVFYGANAASIKHSHVVILLQAMRSPFIDMFVATENEEGSNDFELDNYKFYKSPPSSPSDFEKLRDSSGRDFDMSDFLPSLENEQVKLLDQFYSHLKRIFGTASIIDASDEQYRRKMEDTVAAIIGWDVRNQPIEPSTVTFYMPGCAARERHRVRPILLAIMGKMAQLLGLGPQITSEEGIPKVESRWGSFVDFDATSSAAEYLLATLPAMLCVPMEVKPISHKDGTLGQLLLEAQNQVIRRLANQGMSFLNFGGLGVDCTLFGLELTMGSIAVVVLELSGVGTDDVEVSTRRTRRVPLFDQDIRKHLFGDKASDVDASFEGTEEEQQGLPAGFSLLARTVMSVQSGLGSSLKACIRGCQGSVSMHSNDVEPLKMGRYFGSGVHSHVFELGIKGSDNVFINVPKSFGIEKALATEAEALKDLFGHRCIPELYDIDDPIKTLDIRIRCQRATIPCLPWRGLIGKPTSHKRRWESYHLKTIFKEVHATLLHAHQNGRAHLNVKPSNIITSGDPPGDGLQVMLIRWDFSRRHNEVLNGFVGCLPFAHDEILGRTVEWTPRLDHDLASLAYTMVCLLYGRIPWSGFTDGSAVSDNARKRRFNVVSCALKPLFREWDISRRDKKALLKAIQYRRSKPRKRKRKRNRGKGRGIQK